jgi:hypothetical protein
MAKVALALNKVGEPASRATPVFLALRIIFFSPLSRPILKECRGA